MGRGWDFAFGGSGGPREFLTYFTSGSGRDFLPRYRIDTVLCGIKNSAPHSKASRFQTRSFANSAGRETKLISYYPNYTQIHTGRFSSNE